MSEKEAEVNLGIVLKKWRLMNELSLRGASKIIGIPFVTLNRLEMGYEPMGKTLRVVLSWLLQDRKP